MFSCFHKDIFIFSCIFFTLKWVNFFLDRCYRCFELLQRSRNCWEWFFFLDLFGRTHGQRDLSAFWTVSSILLGRLMNSFSKKEKIVDSSFHVHDSRTLCLFFLLLALSIPLVFWPRALQYLWLHLALATFSFLILTGQEKGGSVSDRYCNFPPRRKHKKQNLGLWFKWACSWDITTFLQARDGVSERADKRVISASGVCEQAGRRASGRVLSLSIQGSCQRPCFGLRHETKKLGNGK